MVSFSVSIFLASSVDLPTCHVLFKLTFCTLIKKGKEVFGIGSNKTPNNSALLYVAHMTQSTSQKTRIHLTYRELGTRKFS